MIERHVNNELMYRIGFTNIKDIESYRNIYYNIIGESEEDFLWSMVSWWNDGNAPFYEDYIKKVWSC